ncbi:MAG: hypothetical protein QXI33_02825 [Candidatus Pacearchaeota archaeon]
MKIAGSSKIPCGNNFQNVEMPVKLYTRPETKPKNKEFDISKRAGKKDKKNPEKTDIEAIIELFKKINFQRPMNPRPSVFSKILFTQDWIITRTGSIPSFGAM